MTKEEIKDIYSMRDILERYGLPQPNRAGFICCPFHKEKTASMKIYQKDFHCFACAAHGDIFSFVMMMEDLPFSEAFKALGGTYAHEGGLSRHQIQRQKAIRDQKRLEAKQRENEFKRWRCEKLSEVCNLLCLCDGAERLYEPFSDEWAYLISLRQKNEYTYQILGFGSRQDQEEMRNQDE